MEQYKEILSEVLDKGTWKKPARKGMPSTISRFSIEKRFDLSRGFPLVTIKETKFSNIAHELIWFLNGDNNIKYLVDNGVGIWNSDAYKYYVRLHKYVTGFDASLTKESFIRHIKNGELDRTSICEFVSSYRLGYTGYTYPLLWNKYPGTDTNQINKLIKGLKSNPYSRYHIINAWHPGYVNEYSTALPPCHMVVQFNMRPSESEDGNVFLLDCKMTQRSCDTFLGVPYNIASYALLTHIIANKIKAIPGEFIWSGNDVHLYENHIDAAKLILSREPKELPYLHMDIGEYSKLDIKMFYLENYKSHPFVKGELSVGE